MASEIRANKSTNRAGLGTVTYTDTGIVVSGIVTANSFSGPFNGDLDVDGHTNLDNVSVAGVSTFADDVTIQKKLSFGDSDGLDTNIAIFGAGTDLKIFHSSDVSYIDCTNNFPLRIQSNDFRLRKQDGNEEMITAAANGTVRLFYNGVEKFSTFEKGIKVGSGVTIETNGQATFTGIVTATSFSGDGSSLSNLPAGAPVGGASTNTVFFENDTAVAVNYQITSGKNAMSAGPIAINAGIAVTVPSGSSWTIV